MSYQEQYATAKKDKAVKKITVEYHAWEKKGEEIIGKFIGTHALSGRDNTSGYNQYLFVTDEGHVKFAMGSVADGEILPLMVAGHVYRVVYQGQEKIKGNRRVNRFDVEEILVPDGAAVGGSEDTSF